MISPKFTYLNTAVLTGIITLTSTATFADTNEAAAAKPFVAINIQDFSDLANLGNTQSANVEEEVTTEYVQDSNGQYFQKIAEDPNDTIAEAIKAGVINDTDSLIKSQDGNVVEQSITIEASVDANITTQPNVDKPFSEQLEQPMVKPVIEPEIPEIQQPVVQQPETQPFEESPVILPTDEDDVSPVEASTNNKDGNDSTISGFENQNHVGSVNLSQYSQAVNAAVWSPDMKTNTAMTIKIQALLDWNHASPGPVDGGWGENSRKALKNFQAMKGIPTTGRMNQATWNELTKNISSNRSVLINYTITKADASYRFTQIPAGYENKAKLSALNYNNMPEMIAERFHMSVGYLKMLNPNKKFVAGETIAVFNPSNNLRARINRIVADKKAETLYAYNGNKLVATYPTTVGSAATPSPHGKFKIVNRVKKPHYRATVEHEDKDNEVFMLKPGPNSPVGIVWMGLSKPSYGIHGSPIPEGISRQASHGCIRLTNWDVLEVYANIKTGAKVELK